MKMNGHNPKNAVTKSFPSIGTRGIGQKEMLTIPVGNAQLLKRKARYHNFHYHVFKPQQGSYFGNLKTVQGRTAIEHTVTIS